MPIGLVFAGLEAWALRQGMVTPSRLGCYFMEFASYRRINRPDYRWDPREGQLPLLLGLWLEALRDHLLGAERPRDYPGAPLSWAAAHRRGLAPSAGPLQRGGLLLLAFLGGLLLGGGVIVTYSVAEGGAPRRNPMDSVTPISPEQMVPREGVTFSGLPNQAFRRALRYGVPQGVMLVNPDKLLQQLAAEPPSGLLPADNPVERCFLTLLQQWQQRSLEDRSLLKQYVAPSYGFGEP